MNLGQLYLDSVIKRFNEYKALGEKTFEQLMDDDFFIQPNDDSNSISIIIQHLHGNMLSRWTNFLTEDGEKTWRLRDEEFEEQHYDRKQIIDKWNEGWKVFLDTLQSIHVEDLDKTIHIRNQPLTVIDAINRQLAHYSYHIGQIVYLGRWFRQSAWKSLSIPKRRT